LVFRSSGLEQESMNAFLLVELAKRQVKLLVTEQESNQSQEQVVVLAQVQLRQLLLMLTVRLLQALELALEQ
jgi:hypothetical protein